MRIIPTRVGTSHHGSKSSADARDHPHACGDKCRPYVILQIASGSSPRVWGQVDISVNACYCVGIIPTRVGTRRPLPTAPTTHRDHPHACGDKAIQTNGAFYPNGSSPRVWGQVIHPFCEICMIGIIPTRVGTRAHEQNAYYRAEDHPHACGDKKSLANAGITFPGSSPRVWGQAQYYFAVAHGHRIIPTRVGTSFALNDTDTINRDHPHACGDKRGIYND